MTMQDELPVNTASKAQSVWRKLDQDSFRKHIVDLQRVSKEVPADPLVHSLKAWQANHAVKKHQCHLLSLEAEQQIADDLAFIAAAEEGAKEVSAVVLEETAKQSGLIFRLAANGPVSNTVIHTLKAMLNLLHRCATRSLSREACAQSILDHVIISNENRILGRLESVHWRIPGSRRSDKRRPLGESIHKLSSALKEVQTSVLMTCPSLVTPPTLLCNALQRVEDSVRDSNDLKDALMDAIKHVHGLCTSGGMSTLEHTITARIYNSLDVASQKAIRRIDKIGRYWGLCLALAFFSRRYATLFKNSHLEVLPPYEAVISKIAFTPVARAPCHVHAEIQLLVHYSKRHITQADGQISDPRVIGVSKSCCYLCNLVITKHNEYFVTKTHGHLYTRWTFPDLIEYSPFQRDKFRSILREIDKELQTRIRIESTEPGKRQHPMGSWLTLPPALQQSPVPSTILSSVAEETTDTRAGLVDAAASTQAALHLIRSPPISEISIATITPGTPIVASTPNAASTSSSTISTIDKEKMKVQSLRIVSDEIPIQRTITSESPFRSKVGEVSVTFEVDDAVQGGVTMTNIRDEGQSSSGTTIDMQTLEVGELRHCYREDGEDSIRFNLGHSSGQLTNVQLQWL